MANAKPKHIGRTSAFGTYGAIPTMFKAVRGLATMAVLRAVRTEFVAQRLAFLHFAHWVVLDKATLNRLIAARGAHVDHPYLFFFSQFTGQWEHYLEAFGIELYVAVNAVWGNTAHWPDARNVSEFLDYVRRQELESPAFYHAYGAADAIEVRGALNATAAVERLLPLAADPERHGELQAAYDRMLLDLGPDLIS